MAIGWHSWTDMTPSIGLSILAPTWGSWSVLPCYRYVPPWDCSLSPFVLSPSCCTAHQNSGFTTGRKRVRKRPVCDQGAKPLPASFAASLGNLRLSMWPSGKFRSGLRMKSIYYQHPNRILVLSSVVVKIGVSYKTEVTKDITGY